MTEKVAKKISELTRAGYEKIQEPFDATRRFPWQEFTAFDEYVNEGMRVLDIGCGNGRLLEWLKSRGKIDYTGVDGNAYFLKQADKEYGGPHRRFMKADFLELDSMPSLAEKKFDVIFCCATFHHIPSAPLREKFLQTVRSLLQPEGIFIFTNWNLWRLTLKEKSIWKYLPARIRMPGRAWKERFGFARREVGIKDVMTVWVFGSIRTFLYYHAFTARELKGMVKKTGFGLIDIYYSKRSKRAHWWSGRNIITICKH